MAVPNSMQDLATLASSNSPAGSEAIGNSLDNYLRAHAAIIRSTNATASATIAAASTTDLSTADGESVQVTGAATITSLGTGFAGCRREVRFSGGCTLVHSGNLFLPGGVNLVTANNDIYTFRCIASGVWALVAASSKAVGFTPVNKAGDTGIGPLSLTGLLTVANQVRGQSRVFVSDGSDTTAPTGKTASLGYLSGVYDGGLLSAYDYTAAAYRPLKIDALYTETTTPVRANSRVYVQDGANVTAPTGKTGILSYLSGIYDGTSLASYDYTAAAYKPLKFEALSIETNCAITINGGKKISQIQLGTTAPGALADGVLYLRY